MRVLEKPSLINNLQHHLTFATDNEVNNAIITKFRLYDYITDNDNANKFILSSIINEWKDYANKLFETTQYEYNPIWNVDGTEKITTTTQFGHVNTRTNGLTVTTEQKVNASDSTTYGRTITENQTKDATAEVFENAYNTSESYPTHNEKTNNGTTTNSSSGTDSVTRSMGKIESSNSGNDVDTESGTNTEIIDHVRSGNIGVTSTQSLIEQERKIIIDVIDFYVNKFADAFAFSNSTLFEPLDV